MRNLSFQEQVEGAVHDVLRWYFAQHEHQKIGGTMPRSGRAAVVKRYEELSMIPGANPVHDLAQIVASHGLIDPLSTKNDGTGSTMRRTEVKDQLNYQKTADQGTNRSLAEAPRNFVLENKNPRALEALRWRGKLMGVNVKIVECLFLFQQKMCIMT